MAPIPGVTLRVLAKKDQIFDDQLRAGRIQTYGLCDNPAESLMASFLATKRASLR